jgi:hypothetical protein
MNGFYLYCIREKQNAAFAANGLFEHSQAFALRFNDLEAIVSKVPLDQLGEEQIQQKAQEDLNWIKEMAQRHEWVIEQAMQTGGEIHSVIPMRFGTVFMTRENVEQTLETEYRHYSECLTHLKQKQEWSVKLYLTDRAPFQAEVSETDPVLIRRKKEIEAMPKGMAYFFQAELNDLILKSVNEKTATCSEWVFNALEQFATFSLQGKLLEKEFTGRSDPMILNAIYLIFEEKLTAFKQEIAELHGMLKSKGIHLEFSGPWPPYHFVKV